MKKISGNKLLVKALKEEGVDTISDIRVHVRLISVTNCISRIIQRLFFQGRRLPWYMKRMLMQDLPGR